MPVSLVTIDFHRARLPFFFFCPSCPLPSTSESLVTSAMRSLPELRFTIDFYKRVREILRSRPLSKLPVPSDENEIFHWLSKVQTRLEFWKSLKSQKIEFSVFQDLSRVKISRVLFLRHRRPEDLIICTILQKFKVFSFNFKEYKLEVSFGEGFLK